MTKLSVEVVFATRNRQEIVRIELEEGALAIDAVHASGLCEGDSELAAGILKLGVFGREISPDARLAEGDRVEIYRALSIEPKEARRTRARLAPPRGGPAR